MRTFKIGNSVAFAVAFATAMKVVVSESRSIISIDMTAAGTLEIDADSTPQVGDEIILKVKSDGTARDLTLGTGFTAPALAGTINKTKVMTLVYDGTSFIVKSAAVQIN